MLMQYKGFTIEVPSTGTGFTWDYKVTYDGEGGWTPEAPYPTKTAAVNAAKAFIDGLRFVVRKNGQPAFGTEDTIWKGYQLQKDACRQHGAGFLLVVEGPAPRREVLLSL